MPKKIFVIRHGETDHNKQAIIQGWLDTRLNQTGLFQAHKLAARLAGETIDAIYSSDLKRAYQTAKPLSQSKNLKIIKTKKLRERNLGIFEGKTWDDVNQTFPSLVNKLVDLEDLHWNGLKGESYHQLTSRIKDFFTHLSSQHPNQSIALVTHGGTKRQLLRVLSFHPSTEKITFGNTSVTILIKTKNKYIIKKLNDTSHL